MNRTEIKTQLTASPSHLAKPRKGYMRKELGMEDRVNEQCIQTSAEKLNACLNSKRRLTTDLVNLFKDIIAGNLSNLEEGTTFKHEKHA